MSYRGSHQGDSHEVGGKWSDSGCILNVESVGFPDGLLVSFKRKRGDKLT